MAISLKYNLLFSVSKQGGENVRYAFVGLAFSICQTWAADDKSLDKILRGKPFSNPADIVEMSPVWQAKPLIYRDWGQGATITIKVLSIDSAM